MRYQQKSFSLPGSTGSKAVCEQVGHMDTDRWGKCLRCGEKLRRADESPASAQNAGGAARPTTRIVGA